MIDYGINCIKAGTQWINIWGYIYKKDHDGNSEKLRDVHLRLPFQTSELNTHLKFKTLVEIIKKTYAIP